MTFFRGPKKYPFELAWRPTFFSAVPRYSVCVPSLPDLNGTAPHQIQCALASLQLFAAVGQTSSSLFLAVGKFFEVFAITKRGIGSGPLSVFSAFASKCLLAGFWQFFSLDFFLSPIFQAVYFFTTVFFSIFDLFLRPSSALALSLSFSNTHSFSRTYQSSTFFWLFLLHESLPFRQTYPHKISNCGKKVVTKMSNFAPKKQSVKNN